MAPKCFEIFLSSRSGISAFAFGVPTAGIELQRCWSVNVVSEITAQIARAQTNRRPVCDALQRFPVI